MSDRKYRQRGYMERSESTASKPTPQPKSESFGPRALNMPGSRTVSRCSECGTVLPAMVDASGNCPKCNAALHSCKQCTHLDPSSRFECRQPVPVRVARKDAANSCTSFSMKVAVERETSSGAASATDARRAFENLFKKT